jgi:hypothetical protein
MNSLVDFVSIYPAIAVVWIVGMSVSIGFCVVARARHRRNVKERVANRRCHSDRTRSEQRTCAPPRD